MLSEQTIQELRQILKDDYGKDVTFTEASNIAHVMIGYFDLLGKIFHKNQQNEYEKEK